MPELPDVESTRRYLVSQGLLGRTVSGVELLWPRALRTPSPDEFESGISGRRIRDIRRRAKYLILALDGRPDRSLILHLRMTGSLVVVPAGQERPRYTRNVILLEGGIDLCFVDSRKLGMMWLVQDEDEVLAGLGPEPLDPSFTPDVLAGRLAGRDAPVKALLCDQAVVAGLGNIYADEVLLLAGVHPLKTGSQMSAEEVRLLHGAIVTRLPEATDLLMPLVAGGRPPTEAEQGLELLALPRSEGLPCKRCDTPVKRIPVRGRSSYFCPRCQGD